MAKTHRQVSAQNVADIAHFFSHIKIDKLKIMFLSFFSVFVVVVAVFPPFWHTFEKI